jgi:hypothetical protein
MFHLWQIDPSSSILNDPLERAFASAVTNEFRWTGSRDICENIRSSGAKGDTHLRVVDSIAQRLINRLSQQPACVSPLTLDIDSRRVLWSTCGSSFSNSLLIIRRQRHPVIWKNCSGASHVV